MVPSMFRDGGLALSQVLFAGPLPVFSQRLNAAVTAATCQWLMGPSAVNDVELPGGEVLKGQGVKVERCRVLEESGCASICINSCKVPTQVRRRSRALRWGTGLVLNLCCIVGYRTLHVLHNPQHLDAGVMGRKYYLASEIPVLAEIQGADTEDTCTLI